MSDWSNCEIEDIVWREFGGTDDHIVPHQDCTLVKESVTSDDLPIKLQPNVENDGGQSIGNGGSKSNGVILANEEVAFCSSRIGTRGPLAHCLDMEVPQSLHPLSLVTSNTPPATQDGQMSNMCFNQCNINVGKSKFHAESPDVMSGTVDKSEVCNFSLDNISSSGNGLTFWENGDEREDDLLYYDWSDISNFEDIDRIFRNCDPTFGQRSKADCQSWYSSSSNDIYGSEDTYNLGLQSSSLDLSSINGTSLHLVENSLPGNSPPAADKQSCLGYQSFKFVTKTEQSYDHGGGAGFGSVGTQAPNVNSLDDKPGFNVINEPMKVSEGQYSYEVEGINQLQSSTSNRSYSGPSHIEQFADRKHLPFNLTSDDAYSVQLFTKQDPFGGSETSSYLPMLKSHLQGQADSSLYEDLFFQTAPIVVPDGNTNLSSSYEVSDHFSGSLSHRMGNFSGNLTKTPDKKMKDMVEKPALGPLEQATLVEKQQNDCKQDLGSNRGRINIELTSSTLDASAVYNSSSMPSVSSDDVSVKAISFKQLQDVIDQLDVRTKLCIRDSLFRLARSAEQRHNFSCTSNRGTECRKGAYGTRRQRNRPGEHLSAETETNPIDRSIAHLLFNIPPESAIKPADDAILLESHMITGQIQGSITQSQ